MTRPDQTRPRTRPYRLLSCFLASAVLVAPGTAGEPAAKEPALPSPESGLKWFRKLSPEERLKRVEKMAGDAKAFVPVARADLDLSIVARASVESAGGNDITCLVRSGTRGGTSPTPIKWVIDDGARVKKGDKLLEFRASSSSTLDDYSPASTGKRIGRRSRFDR